MITNIRIAVLTTLLMTGAAQAAEVIDVYRDPDCGCCKDWIKYLEVNGFSVREHVEPNMSKVKQRLGVAPRLASCHTAMIDGKFVEGHVPVAQILDLKSHPDLVGVSVPGMPAGSPGMDYGQTKQPYQVIGQTLTGTDQVVAEYSGN
ncbi:MAG: DUF411 domain-containing protein [Pseudomonas sp.]|jgi:hypothetical protein|uniref:DUF411 domain-containing protein n=1 Tax=Pseudomonas sp. CFII64 TaxID=911242 RepID=UPI000357493B|nr:DUF411 domain-containing protein [Pseudomonas sp. CFII64]EPJ87476.1 metal-binding protein [Pseudomonas sp. CFII64]